MQAVLETYISILAQNMKNNVIIILEIIAIF